MEPLDEDQKKEPKKRLSRRYARILEAKLKTLSVKTERNYHHARADDRRKGRALEMTVTSLRTKPFNPIRRFRVLFLVQ